MANLPPLTPCTCGGQRQFVERANGHGYYVKCVSCGADQRVIEAGLAMPSLDAVLDALEVEFGQFVLVVGLADGRVAILTVGDEAPWVAQVLQVVRDVTPLAPKDPV